MGLKETLGNLANDVKDTVNEGRHRSAAEGEQAKRDVAGDQMSVGDNAKSMVNQAKESLQADTSAAKRETRDDSTL